ncbi:MAG: hypothetical protein Kow0099_08250 [Candidatus Abyssubacteria bacterium]
MPYYYFEAVTADGHVRKRVLKARDKKDADRQLRSSGLQPFLIESAHIARKKKQEKKVHTHRLVRKTLYGVASLSLVGGVAAYLIVLDLSHVDRFDVKALSRSGIISQSSMIIHAKTQEEVDFAREIFSLWEMSFPDTLGGVEIKHKGLMLLYVKTEKERFNKVDLRGMTSALVRAFQRRFDTNNCIVLIVHEDQTIAESRYQYDKVTTAVY